MPERNTHELKFADPLVGLVAVAKKRTTWRLNNEKDIRVDDRLDLLLAANRRCFGIATVVRVAERTFGTLTEEDCLHHELFDSTDKMLQTYEGYYGQPVGLDTPLIVIDFHPYLLCNRPFDLNETDVHMVGAVA